jgi:hypothetical protein
MRVIRGSLDSKSLVTEKRVEKRFFEQEHEWLKRCFNASTWPAIRAWRAACWRTLSECPHANAGHPHFGFELQKCQKNVLALLRALH